MAASGCVDYEPSLKGERKKSLKASETALEKVVDNTVEEVFEKMPNRQREKLANELESGAIATTVRQ